MSIADHPVTSMPDETPAEGDPTAADLVNKDRISDDPRLAAMFASAIDSLEIAAHLEASGVSSQVAMDSFGHSDVFSLANSIYVDTPFRSQEPEEATSANRGKAQDVLRGVLYAAPTLLFAAALNGFKIRPAWWVIPVGLIAAWGLSQATAAFGWAMRRRGDNRSDGLIAVSSLLFTVALSAGLAIGATDVLGGSWVYVAAAVGLAVYISMSGVILFHDREYLLAAALTPGVVGVVLTHLGTASPLTPRQGSWAVVGTLGLVTAVAIRDALRRRWKRPSFTGSDYGRATQYLLHGLCCGILASVFIGFAAASHAQGGALAIAVWPFLLSLGLMEWELRSFRSNGIAALARATDFAQFATIARRSFCRTFFGYLSLLLVLSLAAEAVGRAHHATMLPLLLGAEGALGVAYFLGLLVVSSGRIDLALWCWGIALAALGARLAVAFILDGHIDATAGITASLAGSIVAVIAFLTAGRRVLTSPLTY